MVVQQIRRRGRKVAIYVFLQTGPVMEELVFGDASDGKGQGQMISSARTSKTYITAICPYMESV